MLNKNYLVPILMGSGSDWKGHGEKLALELELLGISYEVHVVSAHRTPKDLLKLIEDYNAMDIDLVFETIAGLSNGLSGMVAGATTYPVIAVPPKSIDGSTIDYPSSYNMPPGISVIFIPDPKNAALCAAKILGIKYPELRKTVENVLEECRKNVIDANEKYKKVK
jgi:5-(carboxyamino)imidazole ribonucleotide mutase